MNPLSSEVTQMIKDSESYDSVMDSLDHKAGDYDESFSAIKCYFIHYKYAEVEETALAFMQFNPLLTLVSDAIRTGHSHRILPTMGACDSDDATDLRHHLQWLCMAGYGVFKDGDIDMAERSSVLDYVLRHDAAHILRLFLSLSPLRTHIMSLGMVLRMRAVKYGATKCSRLLAPLAGDNRYLLQHGDPLLAFRSAILHTPIICTLIVHNALLTLAWIMKRFPNTQLTAQLDQNTTHTLAQLTDPHRHVTCEASELLLSSAFHSLAAALSRDSVPASNALSRECVPASNALSRECVPASNALSRECVPASNALSRECVPASNALSRECVPASNALSRECVPASNALSRECVTASNALSRDSVPANTELFAKVTALSCELLVAANCSWKGEVCYNDSVITVLCKTIRAMYYRNFQASRVHMHETFCCMLLNKIVKCLFQYDPKVAEFHSILTYGIWPCSADIEVRPQFGPALEELLRLCLAYGFRKGGPVRQVKNAFVKGAYDGVPRAMHLYASLMPMRTRARCRDVAFQYWDNEFRALLRDSESEEEARKVRERDARVRERLHVTWDARVPTLAELCRATLYRTYAYAYVVRMPRRSIPALLNDDVHVPRPVRRFLSLNTCTLQYDCISQRASGISSYLGQPL